MRLRALLFATVALGSTGAAAWHLAGFSTTYVETQRYREVVQAVSKAGEDWVSVEADGLEILLSGTAPDEAARFRAMELARRTIEADRIHDLTSVASPEPLKPPRFALELLRNNTDISLIGLVPARTAKDVETSRMIRDDLATGQPDLGITDMLETAEYPEPNGWSDSLAYALDVLGSLPRAKISVEPGRVGIMAVADSPEAKAFLDRTLKSEAPASVDVSLEISSPRPVIAPFELVYSFDGQHGRFERCSAEDEASASRILHTSAGLDTPDRKGCEIGLGAPGADWAEAAIAGISAVDALGQGRFALTDRSAVLTGLPGTATERFESAVHTLSSALPERYSLASVPPPVADAQPGASGDEGVIFVAELAKAGEITLKGAVRDETSRQAIQSYTSALFGHDMVADETVVNAAVPVGWPGRVLAGIDALHQIKEGQLSVTPTDLRLEGWGVSLGVDKKIEGMLGARVENANVDVRFDLQAAAAEARAQKLAAMSRPEICASEIGSILEAQSIEFRPGSAEIDPVSRGVIAAIADVLRTCPAARFEIAGHTDNRGQEEDNLTLSTERADAVRAALEEQDLPFVLFTSQGYGSDFPVAGNETEAGRRKNRRIEIMLFDEALARAESQRQDTVAGQSECADRISGLLDNGSIEFDVGASEIKPSSVHLIAELANALNQCEGTSFEIGGHTDSLGHADVNKRISSARADAVRDALKAAGLSDTITLSSRGYGSENPIADNSTREGRALNRRIEMHLLSPESGADGAADSAAGLTGTTETPDGSD